MFKISFQTRILVAHGIQYSVSGGEERVTCNLPVKDLYIRHSQPDKSVSDAQFFLFVVKLLKRTIDSMF